MSKLKKDLTSILDLDREDAEILLDLGLEFQKDIRLHQNSLAGQTMAMIFEKPSLRTRVTFETGMFQLGGYGIYLAPADISMGKRESVSDTVKNLERWVQVVVARTFSHKSIIELSENSTIPIINALSNDEHPCQSLADLLTLKQHLGQLEGIKISFIGDGNNICNSLLLLCALVGTSIAIASPEGFGPCENIQAQAAALAKDSGAEIEYTQDHRKAVEGCNAVYTDIWASMGQESEQDSRNQAFRTYQVNSDLMKLAEPDALFMHCLPAHRGEEVTDEVIDSKNSVVFDQAENRMHIQKAILYRLMTK